MQLKMLSAKYRPFCPGLDLSNIYITSKFYRRLRSSAVESAFHSDLENFEQKKSRLQDFARSHEKKF